MTKPLGLDSQAKHGRSRRGPLHFFVREGSAIIFAVSLAVLLWGDYSLNIPTTNAAMWHVFAVSLGIMFYIFLQAVAAVTQPLRRQTGPLIDVLVSLLPLMVVVYAAIDWIRQGYSPTVFQLIVIVLAASATLIDVIVFSWFAMRINKLAQEIVEVD